ncbi:type 4a pilus biogenesis protein PilO [Vibrio lentus]|nr:type 4a pilus biogenesis protein PilO [Vibrio lentus]
MPNSYLELIWDKSRTKSFFIAYRSISSWTGDYHEIGDFSAAIAKLPRRRPLASMMWNGAASQSRKQHVAFPSSRLYLPV